jgi:serine/threonine protein phosphatase PrpC/type II secretory pathway pseudopilin PulG
MKGKVLMSTHCFIFSIRKGIGLASLAFLSAPNWSSQVISFFDDLFSPHSVLSILAIGSVVLVVILILLALITLIRRRARQKRLQKEYAEAERIANTTLEEERRKQQQLWAQQLSQKAWSEQPTLTPEIAPLAFQQSTTDPLPCPNCHKPVQRGTTRCPYCGSSMLLPTDSGFYPRTSLVTPSSVSAPLSVPEHQPTVEMSPGATRNGLTDPDKTQTDPLRQANNQNVGFGVITRTDPGIKRKHKPNEDSLFAAQGTREASSSTQQVGLFVVADGMGGHANGQDASRLAIQTIINYILPRLAQNGEVTGNAFQQLLIDGVQCANQAVHQRNMEQRADMGTTMTAALIVAPIGVTYAEDDTHPPTAVGYIANVGDSRTYLYRQGRGLVKLTNDHSVVASLVEAGIIRPDDIYTHPKRNQIYRSLGEKPAVEVDSFVVALEVDDKLLLCSDGLWDMVRDPQIEEVLKNPTPPNMAGDALIQAALNGGGEDNISVIVVQIPDPNKLNARLGIQLIDKPEAVQMPQL